MKVQARSVYVLASNRIPFCKSHTHYRDVTRAQLMTEALRGLVARAKLSGVEVGDVALGAVMNSSREFNLARECVLSTELSPNTPAYNVQRACGTGLETAWQIAQKIYLGQIDLGIAGGVDTNSDVPIEISRQLQSVLIQLSQARTLGERAKLLLKLRPSDLLPVIPNVNEPRTGKSMGEHCELMVKEWKIAREAQDELAYHSHMNGAKAYDEGFFQDLLTPAFGLSKDAILRADTTLERLAKLKPAFDRSASGTLTAGNSTALTDGAACVLLGGPEGASAIGATPLARVIDFEAAAVDFPRGKGLLMAPTKAVARLLARQGLSLQDFDYYELHEAFAGQVLCTLQAWEDERFCREELGLKQALGSLDRSRLNVKGSSLALGHPFAATGARILGTLAKLLSTGKNKRGLISVCTAGGMGVAAILESIE